MYTRDGCPWSKLIKIVFYDNEDINWIFRCLIDNKEEEQRLLFDKYVDKLSKNKCVLTYQCLAAGQNDEKEGCPYFILTLTIFK